ncbi:sigma-70 family RNA polymerase sigma factor [Metabacillus arenae]|uniref:Sigma-70 family RNA polymerase sigma factor n=1 Tax=Metabacillus arenae TaxID=2771434 RepID=A0A926RW47_9BACI|nr:sigma-70 family RNA polymerase sigma factor [Metabacillus arenae]MBD1380403.1 sigma-70 family RNA polymerase sigma factor [Metabacillus arenae]
MNNTFKELLSDYQPMIYHILKKLHIYKNHDEFYQIGMIALWEAYRRYDHLKGSFSGYAYSTIKGKIMYEMTKRNRFEQHHSFGAEETEYGSEDSSLNNIESIEMVEAIAAELTINQKKWFLSYVIEGKTPKEIAITEKVSESAVKSWRRDALKKIRKNEKLKNT